MQESMPPELLKALNGESRDFAVKATKAVPASTAWTGIVFGLIWLLIVGSLLFFFFGPILQGKEVRFKTNGVPTVAGPGNMKPLILPGIFLGVFSLVGLVIFVSSVKSLTEPGPWFVGMPTRMIIYKKGTVQSQDWESFTGTTRLSGPMENATLTFEMRTGRMVRRKNGPSRYVPDKIYLVGIPDGLRIEELCRKRISENDPTPPRV